MTTTPVSRDRITSTWLHEHGIEASQGAVVDLIDSGLVSGVGGGLHRADDLSDQLTTLTTDDYVLFREWRELDGEIRPE